MSDIILRFVKLNGVRILSDGDTDGVFATGFLLRALMLMNVEEVYSGNVEYPRAREMEKLTATGNILIELHTERGIKYSGQNLLIDHHPEPPRVVLYSDQTPILTRKYNISTSAAGLIHYIFEKSLDAPADLVELVDQVDYKNYQVEDTHKLARAFIISRNIPDEKLRDIFQFTQVQVKDAPLFKNLERLILTSSPIYGLLTLALALGDYDSIYEWIFYESQRFENEIVPTVKKLYSRATRIGNLSYVVYNYGDLKERTAADDVFYILQRESEIAAVIGVTTNGFSVRMASLNPGSNLMKLFLNISDKRIKGGGRENIINLYFPNTFFTLADVINTLCRVSQQA
ncbi:MAG: hypothetical protein QXY55_05565 [Candidatus Korarchaeota archaeon]|nr:hypothetical protein [Thermoproteota archaeon]